MWIILLLLQADSAEELFTKMEEKLLKSKALLVEFETEFPGVEKKYKGSFAVEGARVRFEFDAVKFESDGKALKVGAASRAAPPKLGENLVVLFARGCAGIADYEVVRHRAKEPPDLRASVKASGFKLGPKKGGLQRIDFSVDSGGVIGKYAVALWIDTKTLLPVEREWKQGDATTVEKYKVTAPADRR